MIVLIRLKEPSRATIEGKVALIGHGAMLIHLDEPLPHDGMGDLYLSVPGGGEIALIDHQLATSPEMTRLVIVALDLDARQQIELDRYVDLVEEYHQIDLRTGVVGEQHTQVHIDTKLPMDDSGLLSSSPKDTLQDVPFVEFADEGVLGTDSWPLSKELDGLTASPEEAEQADPPSELQGKDTLPVLGPPVEWNDSPWASVAEMARRQGALDTPTRIGRYDLLVPIGVGGMATVYLAQLRGPQDFKKLVAVKVIHPSLAKDPRFVRMFRREATISARFDHPNLPQVLELGELETGLSNSYDGLDIPSVFESEGAPLKPLFIAMECLWGESLRNARWAMVREETGWVSLSAACYVVAQAAEALHYVHEMTDLNGQPLGLIHRDVSPQNLFVTYSGSVKLLDFGIAKAAQSTNTTEPGHVKGKLSYLSPEQVWKGTADRRSDVFALTTTFWEMLTGRRLFYSGTAYETFRKIIQCQVPPISAFRDDVPDDLESVFEKGMEKDPDRRYQNARELHRDITRVMRQLNENFDSYELSHFMRNHFASEIQQKQEFVASLIEQFPVEIDDQETRSFLDNSLDESCEKLLDDSPQKAKKRKSIASQETIILARPSYQRQEEKKKVIIESAPRPNRAHERTSIIRRRRAFIDHPTALFFAAFITAIVFSSIFLAFFISR